MIRSRNMSVRILLILGFGAIVALLALVGVAAYLGLAASQRSQDTLHAHFENVLALNSLGSNLKDERLDVSMMLDLPPAEREPWQKDMAERTLTIGKIAQSLLIRFADQPDKLAKLRELLGIHDEFEKTRDSEILTLLAAGDIENARRSYLGANMARYARMREIASNLADGETREARLLESEVQQRGQILAISFVALASLAALVAIVLAIRLNRRIAGYGVAREEAETRAQRSARYARSLIEASLDPMVTISPDGKIEDVNKATEDAIGAPRDELVGTEFADYFTEPDKAQTGYRQALDQGYVRDYLLTMRHRSGGTTDVLYNATVYRNEAGEVQGVFACARDITQRKETEEKLQAASLYARRLIEASLDPLVTIDADGKITDVNEATVQATGVARARLVGSDFSTYFTEPDKARKGYLSVFEKGFIRDYPLAIRHVSGNVIEVMYNATVYRDENGEVAGVFAAARDVTEHKRAEEELRATSIYARTLIEANPDPLVTISPEGKITDVNEATVQVTGVPRKLLEGSDFSNYFTEPEKARNGYQEAFAKGAVTDYPLALRHLSGKVTDVLYNARVYRDEKGEIAGVLAAARDITERKRNEQELQRTNRALRTISSCNQTLIHATEESGLLDDMCRIIVEHAGYGLAWVGFADHDEQKTVRPVAHAGYKEGYIERAIVTWADNEQGRGPTGTAIRTQKPSLILDAQTDPAYLPWRENSIKLGYRSVLALPLASHDQVLGALTIYSPESRGFSEQEIGLLSELSGDLAFGIISLRIRKLQQEGADRLLRSMEGSISAMAATVELRDPYTAGHQHRVAELSRAIARELKLPDDEVRGIYFAALIHDLGKIHIPAEILTKPAELTSLEFQIIQTHPQAGYDILKEIDFPWPIAQMVLQHHERMDGSGYPNGLKESDIVLGARILAVADTVEAMSTHRPYRPSQGIAAALREITTKRNERYDSDVVDACLTLILERGYSLSA